MRNAANHSTASIFPLTLLLAFASCHRTSDATVSSEVVSQSESPLLWASQKFDQPGHEPFSFRYGGVTSSAVLSSWPRSVSPTRTDAHSTRREILYRDPASGLEVRVDITEYSDFSAAEWFVRFKNTGTADSSILENILPLDIAAGGTRTSRSYRLSNAFGSSAAVTDFQPDVQLLAPGGEAILKPFGGLPSSGLYRPPVTDDAGGETAPGALLDRGALPFFNLAYPDGNGLAGAVGWTGQWKLAFARAGTSTPRVQAGMERTHLRLHPGEEIRTPSVLLLFWNGADESRGQALLRRLLLAHYAPRVGGTLQRPPIAASGDAALTGDAFEVRNEMNMRDGINHVAGSWCDPNHLKFGDYNGDGKRDLSCHSEQGQHAVAFSNGDGTFSPRAWWNGSSPWCDPNHLKFGDYNGDGKLDLSCHSDQGQHVVAFSNGDGTFSPRAWWNGSSPWCDPNHLHFGDYNGDSKLDLSCHSDQGEHLVAFSNGDGTFSPRTWWNGTSPWCDPAHLELGDYNGDGKTDLGCHSDWGRHTIASSNGDGSFAPHAWWHGKSAWPTIDTWWIDAGWTESPSSAVNGWSLGVGNFDPDPVRFPNGLKPVADFAHEGGLRFALWFEPERVMPSTWLARNHPEWLLDAPASFPLRELDYMRDSQFKLLNLGNPAAREWLRTKVSETIAHVGIDVYRHDFNMFPLGFWQNEDLRLDPRGERDGITEIQHVTGLYTYLDELKQDHPNLIIDDCSSGGRRIDIEMLRRAFVLTRTDYLWDPTGQQNHTFGISRWLPITGIGTARGTPSEDAYRMRSGLGYHQVLALDFYRATSSDWANFPPLLDQLASVRELFLGDFTPLSGTTNDETVCVAWQYDRTDLGQGLVQAFRRRSCPQRSMLVHPVGLLRGRNYRVSDQDGGASWTVTGDRLLDEGLTIPFDSQPQAKVFVYALVR